MHRHPSAARCVVAALATLVVACGSTPTGPLLTDPKAIVTAALKATEAAKSVHLDATAAGTASVALPIAGGSPVPFDVTGTTASADVDFARPAVKGNVSVPEVARFAAEVIAVDGVTYTKTTLTGPLYQASTAQGTPFDAAAIRDTIDNLGDLLLKPGVNLVKGDDVACGSKSCYTVSTNLTADNLGTAKSSAIAALPIDLAGATLKLTVRVEKDLPYHLAGVTAVVSTPKNDTVTIELTASKWDEPVSVAAPAPDKIKASP
jgi:hypothetical protein